MKPLEQTAKTPRDILDEFAHPAQALIDALDRAGFVIVSYPIEFVDKSGRPGKLKLRNGAWFFDGVIA